MMQLLYATQNNSKIYNMKRRLKDLPIDLVTPKDLNLKLEILEDGQSPKENALKKAYAYFKQTQIPTIGADSGLYIDRVPKQKQPGLFVRRVEGKELNDEEMIAYYTKLIDSVGGKSMAYYLTGLAIVNESGIYTTEIQEDPFIMTSIIDREHAHRGNPLDVITIDPHLNKYYSAMSDDEFIKNSFLFEKQCVSFIQETLIAKEK